MLRKVGVSLFALFATQVIGGTKEVHADVPLCAGHDQIGKDGCFLVRGPELPAREIWSQVRYTPQGVWAVHEQPQARDPGCIVLCDKPNLMSVYLIRSAGDARKVLDLRSRVPRFLKTQSGRELLADGDTVYELGKDGQVTSVLNIPELPVRYTEIVQVEFIEGRVFIRQRPVCLGGFGNACVIYNNQTDDTGLPFELIDGKLVALPTEPDGLPDQRENVNVTGLFFESADRYWIFELYGSGTPIYPALRYWNGHAIEDRTQISRCEKDTHEVRTEATGFGRLLVSSKGEMFGISDHGIGSWNPAQGQWETLLSVSSPSCASGGATLPDPRFETSRNEFPEAWQGDLYLWDDRPLVVQKWYKSRFMYLDDTALRTVAVEWPQSESGEKLDDREDRKVDVSNSGVVSMIGERGSIFVYQLRR